MQLRSYFRFGLRTLLVVVTLACMTLVIFVLPARRQRQAVLELRRRGVSVDYGMDPFVAPPPTWSQTWLECDFGESVRVISIWGRPALTEEEWQLILNCQPTVLSITAEKEGDRDIANVSGLRALQDLYVTNPSVTERSTTYLAQLRHLRTLQLRNTNITDSGLARLSALRELQSLTIGDATVTEKGIALLQEQLPQCEIIWTSGLTREE